MSIESTQDEQRASVAVQRLVRVWWDCPKCGAKPPTAHILGGGPHFDGIRTCGNGCGTWETVEEWQAIRDANDLALAQQGLGRSVDEGKESPSHE